MQTKSAKTASLSANHYGFNHLLQVVRLTVNNDNFRIGP
jgi:hypothetical protein